jgi:hypothetical protein
MLDEPISATVCVLPELVDILSAAQAASMAAAVRSLEPFGLSITLPENAESDSTATVLVRDLFVPTDETFHDKPLLRGIDTNNSIFACSRVESPDTWVISSSSDRSTWARCEGDVWIDRLSGKALATGRSPLVPTILVHRGLGETCGSLLRFAVMPSTHRGILAFPKSIRADEVACWLARLFGPQSAFPSGQVPSSIKLPEGLGAVRLLTDIVLARGRSLVLTGGGNTVIVGSHQLRVAANALLTLEFVTVANSVRSTAIAIEAGFVRLSNSTVRNCSVYMNAVNADGLLESRGGAISVNAAGRLELVFVDLYANSVAEGDMASGGAIFCTGGSSISVSRSKLRGNVAHRAGLRNGVLEGAASGGAVFLSTRSSLVVLESELFQNAARDGGYWSQAGAVYVCDGSSVMIRGSKLYENIVENGGLHFGSDKEDAGCYGSAIVVELKSSAEFIECEVCDNIARAGAQWTQGGAMLSYDGSSLLIARSKLLRNAVHGAGSHVDGGAVSLYGGDDPSIGWLNESEISDNGAIVMDGGAAGAQGGAMIVSQAQLTVVNCKLHRNMASGGLQALGGAFFFDAGSKVLLWRSNISNNLATGGALFARGGGIFADISGAGELRIESTALSQNCANGSAAPAAGGGLYSKSGSATFVDCDLTANAVMGRIAYGGALYSSGTTLAIRTVVTKNTAFSIGVQGEAFGAGMFSDGVMLRLVASRLLENVASIASPAEQVSAGALYIAVGARAILDGCFLQSNTAGGLGLQYFYDFSYNDAKRASYEGVKAAHIFTAGILELTHTVIVDESNFAPIEYGQYSAQTWIVVGGGTLYLHSSNFSAGTDSAATDSDSGLWLLATVPMAEKVAEILIRQCTVRNLKLQWDAKQTVGVVSSNFEPPLNNSMAGLLQPGKCGTVVANEQMCDTRALCEWQTTGGAPSGGVRCACIGLGLLEKPPSKLGKLQDGLQCEQAPSIKMLLQSQEVSIVLAKPRNGSADVQIVVLAGGESRMAVAFTSSMVHRSAAVGSKLRQNSSRTWSRLDEARLSLDGHHLSWSTPPPANDSNIELDGDAERYAVTKQFAFQLGLDCHGKAGACVADGDTVETLVEVESGSLRSTVRITTHVESLISCDHSKAWIEHGLESVPTSTAIRVHLEAYDVDILPISYTRAPVEFRFGSHLLPQRWDRGSNEYVAEVSADVTGQAGRYELVVVALNGSAGRCKLLSRSIEVASSKSQEIVAGCLAGAMVLTLGMLGYLLYRKKEKLKEVMLSFLEFEGLLMLELCLEAWVTLRFRFRVARFEEARDSLTSLAYSCVLCDAGPSRRRILLPHRVPVQVQGVGERDAHPLLGALRSGMLRVALGLCGEIATVHGQVALERF